ncbi:GtrA family protein [Herbaspirillum huttiense]|uniref:GtrA family protein n=1 Tax=Herbaspirillum huttiense TaxID=863372 RepID=UPI001065A6AF|nr:GtrA family protein [Herbaspirillum huttiense]QBP78132.1 GtrA family protein [Herbaspirillum huttiense]
MAFSRFFIAGLLNTGVTYLGYLGLLRLIPYTWAYTVTFVAGICFGYLLNTYWVFKQRAGLRSATFYPLTYAVNYVLGLGLIWMFVDLLKVPRELAPVLVMAISVPIMYFLTKHIFRASADHEKIDN